MIEPHSKNNTRNDRNDRRAAGTIREGHFRRLTPKFWFPFPWERFAHQKYLEFGLWKGAQGRTGRRGKVIKKAKLLHSL